MRFPALSRKPIARENELRRSTPELIASQKFNGKFFRRAINVCDHTNKRPLFLSNAFNR
jgi:hypothetical protein